MTESQSRSTVLIVLSVVFSGIALLFIPLLFGGLALLFAFFVYLRDSKAGTICLAISGIAMALGAILGGIVGMQIYR